MIVRDMAENPTSCPPGGGHNCEIWRRTLHLVHQGGGHICAAPRVHLCCIHRGTPADLLYSYGRVQYLFRKISIVTFGRHPLETFSKIL